MKFTDELKKLNIDIETAGIEETLKKHPSLIEHVPTAKELFISLFGETEHAEEGETVKALREKLFATQEG